MERSNGSMSVIVSKSSAQQQILLSGLCNLLGHLDQVTEHSALRTRGNHRGVQGLNKDLGMAYKPTIPGHPSGRPGARGRPALPTGG